MSSGDPGRIYVASCAEDGSGGVVAYEDAPGGLQIVADDGGDVGGLLALALHPSGRVLYGAGSSSTIVAVHVLDGVLDRFSECPSGGEVPCALVVDPSERFLLTANYLSGTLAVHALRKDASIGRLAQVVSHDGRGPDEDRQDGPHLHDVVFDRMGNVLVTDLGADAIYVYRFDGEHGRLELSSRTSAPPRAGPRTLALAGETRVLVSDELSGVISWYDRSAGHLRWKGSIPASRSRSTQPANFPGSVIVNESGRFAYVANRGHDTIAVFSLGTRGLTHIADVKLDGSWPQHLARRGSTLYCALQHDDSVVALTVDADTGVPKEARKIADVRRPSWIIP